MLQSNRKKVKAHNFGFKYADRIFNKSVRPVSRFTNGETLKLCRECGDLRAPREMITGEMPGKNDTEIFVIQVKRIVGECGHVVENSSH